MPTATWSILTPPAGQGAIALVQLRGDDPDDFARRLASIALDIPPGRPALVDLLGIDRGIAVRWDPTTIDLCPHGGPAVVRRLVSALSEHGFTPDPGCRYPEAADEIEARMLAALARAASPLAVDILLAQPDRWRAHKAGPPADETVLNRLLDPPLVVAVGPANIGKSTLLNALAGRAVAVVADQPGTTRDHVGATLEVGGLAIRYLDTPGRLETASQIDRDARELVEHSIGTADLLLLCGDPASPCPERPPGRLTLRLCLRTDLGEPGWACDARVSALTGEGLDTLAGMIRGLLVPDEALADNRPWRFWEPDGRAP